MRFDRHRHTEERRHDVVTEERLVPFIARVRDERHAGWNQLWASGIDLNAAAKRAPSFCTRTNRETDAVIGARYLPVFELGLGDRRLEIDIPQRRRLELICEAAAQQP